jgi:hypothetical protein
MPLGVVLFTMFYYRSSLSYTCISLVLPPPLSTLPLGFEKRFRRKSCIIFCLHLHLVLVHFDNATIWILVRFVDL